MQSERPSGLTVRESSVILGRVVSVCSMGRETLGKGVGCEGAEVAEVQEKEEKAGQQERK